MSVRDDRLRREAKADAVIAIAGAKLLNRFVRVEDAARAVGVTQGELKAALERLRLAHAAARPEPRPVPRPPYRRGRRRKDPAHVLDDLVLSALTLGQAGPADVRERLSAWGQDYPLAAISDCLARLVAARKVEHPALGTYRRVA